MQRHRQTITKRRDRAPSRASEAGERFVELVRGGDRDGATALLNDCCARLRGYLRMRFEDRLGGRQGVEEVISAAIWKAVEHAGSYRPERGELSFWLWRIGVNEAQDEIRRSRIRRRHESGSALEPAASTNDSQELGDAVRVAIGRLRDARHRAILLADLDHGGLAPASALAEKLGLKEQTVLNLRNEARKLAKPLLEELLNDGS